MRYTGSNPKDLRVEPQKVPPKGAGGVDNSQLVHSPGNQAKLIGIIFMPCLPCAANIHWECLFPTADELCCCDSGLLASVTVESSQRGGPIKEAENMKDPISTGRKRAAIAKPIEEGMVCEWAGLKFAGGGVEPIIGCNGNIATNIHHGPDKDVLNNDVDTNLHRVCPNCHNRWHTLNDPYYGIRPTPGTPFLPLIPFICKPHDSDTKADLKEIFENEMYWSNKKTVKAKD